MQAHLRKAEKLKSTTLSISGSKSESNRLLLLQKLFGNIQLENNSDAHDVEMMQLALKQDDGEVDIHHAGTAMRFLTAYFAVQKGKSVLLTGSQRMQNRPIQILVEALQQLGADITYADKKGYPPLKIVGRNLTKNKIKLNANVSSQYISALLLIAPQLENGLKLELVGQITSLPYLKMTLSLLKELGVSYSFNNQVIEVFPAKKIKPLTYTIESDWSSASYHFSIVALAEHIELNLTHFKEDSLQGDAKLMEFYTNLGVESVIENGNLQLRKKSNFSLPKHIQLDLIKQPDLAQTIAVSCLGLGIECRLTGLHTLKIKETDRLQALKNEMQKLGAHVEIDHESLQLIPPKNINAKVSIQTYQDHRMAMAFAPLAIKNDILITDAEVVEKSYPQFWKDLEKIGFEIKYS